MSGAKDVKDDRKYTKDHEWAKQDGAETVVGITAFAVEQLGDITLVNVDVRPGDSVEAHKAFGTIESVKTLSDVFAPVTGKVTRINGALEDSPELINEDCWDKGWIVAIEPAGTAPADLLDAAQYRAHVEASEH
jgi:glycine cleavage system H protein